MQCEAYGWDFERVISCGGDEFSHVTHQPTSLLLCRLQRETYSIGTFAAGSVSSIEAPAAQYVLVDASVKHDHGLSKLTNVRNRGHQSPERVTSQGVGDVFR